MGRGERGVAIVEKIGIMLKLFNIPLVAFVIPLILGCENKSSTHEDKLDAIVSNYMDDTDYVGIALTIKKNRKTLYQKGYGFADKESNTPFQTSSLISLGSNTKTITASSILLLEEGGLLSIDDNINHHLPQKLNVGKNITIRNLLCHTSGLPNVYGEGEFENYQWQNAKSKYEFIDKLNALEFQPTVGERYHYNNTGYYLLGLIIESTSKLGLGEFYKEYFFSPLKMTNIFDLGSKQEEIKLVEAYEKEYGLLQKYTNPVDYWIVGGAGSIGGNINEYVDIFSTIVSGNFLSKIATSKLLSPCTLSNGDLVINNKNRNTVALGVELFESDGEKVILFGGALNGYVSAVYYFPKHKLSLGLSGNTWAPIQKLGDIIINSGLHKL